MSNYIKSHSNYVLKKKHQDINSGTIFERDITTIGGLNQFAKGQTPIYKSSNFIITVNNETLPSRQIDNGEWFKSPNGYDIWTMEDVNMLNGEVKESCEVVLKQDYYSLRDFAYYGSCVELIRASINNIVTKFPGSIYVPSVPTPKNGSEGISVYYETFDNVDGKQTRVNKRLGDEDDKDLILVSNPSNINLHTQFMNESEITDVLKYMCNEGFKNYIDENGNEITWEVTKKFACIKDNNGKCKVSEITEDNKKNIHTYNVPIGSQIATINLNGITIYAYKGNGGEIVYLTDNIDTNIDKLIATPRTDFFVKFYNSLDLFEKLLINPNSKPKYSALFEVISENSFGYETELKRFTFPTKDNGYNLCVGDGSYEEYINSFLKYAELYDEVFSDNLWRSMTHEAIKNFDWSYTRSYSEGDEEDYIIGGTKIQKVIRLFGREFDEIKAYIDGIKGYNQITYGSDNMLPNYYITDVLNDEGWDVVTLNPFKLSTDKNNKEVLFQLSNLENITPYNENEYQYGYFSYIENNERVIEKLTESDKHINYKVMCNEQNTSNILIHKTIDYISDKEYTLDDVNNEVLKRLILNSRYIWRRKGTIEGIESLLSIFGLKSSRMDKDDYDYKVTEYAVKVSSLEDVWNDRYSMNLLDWYNTTKTVTYNTEDFRQGIYHSYQGLPIRSYVFNNGKYYKTSNLPSDLNLKRMSRHLLPYFSKNMKIDGDPYYQMNGGWLKKSRSFDKYNNFITDLSAHTETYRDIRSVENLKELVSLPMQDLKNNDVYYVNDLSNKYYIVDGVIYDIHLDEYGHEYIKTYIFNNSVKVGIKQFADEITVSTYNGGSFKYVFSQYPNGSEMRIYLYGDKNIFAVGKYYSIGTAYMFEHNNNMSHYFQLNDVQNKMKINIDGWYQIPKESDKHKWLNTIIDKFSGNNPHNGHLTYDNGYEYIKYFEQLFKYAIENNEFNERCYDNFLNTLEEIKYIGFDFNTNENCEYICDDNKINNKIDTTLINKIDKNGFETIINNVDFESDKVVNTKRVRIDFKADNTNKEIIKYYDYVILNYLEQVLPSTLIVEINYDENI